MQVIIHDHNKKRYSIDGYKYKVLKSSLPDLIPVPSGVSRASFKNLDDLPSFKKHIPNSETQESNEEEVSEHEPDQSELIDSLLKKADDFSSKFLKAQMDLEELQEQSVANEERIKNEAYEAGLNDAKETLSNETAQVESGLYDQLKNSVQSLSNESEQFSKGLVSIQEELIGAAVDIAKEVIQKELSSDASQIALDLARSLMREIDKESKITLKVHPEHMQTFTEALGGSDRIRLIEDNAVRLGGVIVNSNLGTIEADIMSRYEQVKRNIQNG